MESQIIAGLTQNENEGIYKLKLWYRKKFVCKT